MIRSGHVDGAVLGAMQSLRGGDGWCCVTHGCRSGRLRRQATADSKQRSLGT